MTSDFFSDFFPSATAWQRLQGCSPSNVFTTASQSEACRAFAINIVAHATDWRATQWNPIDRQSATIVSVRPILEITAERRG